MTLGQNIQAARKNKGLSQEALAEQVGVSRQALGKWEKDTALPSLDNLQALAAALDVGNIELVKPNQKELSALVQRDLSQPDDVRLAAQSLIQSGKVRRVVVSLGPQGALGVDASGSVQVVPPPMKSQSTVGAGDSMVGAMTLRLAENASLEDMVRFGVAAGSAATINQGTRLCSRANTQKIYDYLCGR